MKSNVKLLLNNINDIFCALSRSKKHISNDFSIDTLSLFFSLFWLSAVCLPVKYITTNEWIQMQVLLFYLFVLFKIQIAVTQHMEGFFFHFLHVCFGRTNKNLKTIKHAYIIKIINHQFITWKKYTQYVYIYIVNHIVLSLMINKSTTNRMQCYSLIRI